MRTVLKQFLFDEIARNPKIIVVTADLGYKMWDDIQARYPDNFLNVGAAEQLMLGVCVGMSYNGRLPIAYSITPFLLYRGFEILRNYVGHENANIKLVGSGLENDYSHDGFSHQDFKYKEACRILDIPIHTPQTKNDLQSLLPNWIKEESPSFLGLRR